jgi:putative (di)nucleoside polyphosphate hydrolase
LDAVIDFKREVYTQALNELSPLIFKRGQEVRFDGSDSPGSLTSEDESSPAQTPESNSSAPRSLI